MLKSLCGEEFPGDGAHWFEHLPRCHICASAWIKKSVDEMGSLKLQVRDTEERVKNAYAQGYMKAAQDIQKNGMEGFVRTEDVNRQIDVFRSAYRARYAVQLHEAQCGGCADDVVCLMGQELRNAANIAEETAGEADSEITEKREPQEPKIYESLARVNAKHGGALARLPDKLCPHCGQADGRHTHRS